MNNSVAQTIEERLIRVPAGAVTLEGNLTLPEQSRGIVLFAHGSGSSRHSPRNKYVAEVLHNAGLATLLFDLLTPAEEASEERTVLAALDLINSEALVALERFRGRSV